MYYKGHGSEVKVDIMLLLVANNCWTRQFHKDTDYFISLVFYFDSDGERKPLQVKECLEWVCMLPFYPCLYWGQSIYVTVSRFIVLNQLIAGPIMVRHMKLILVLSLPLRVYYFMRCTHNALWGVIMTSFDSTWPYFWLCLLYLARSARFDVTGWYVYTFPVDHGFIVSLRHELLGCWR